MKVVTSKEQREAYRLEMVELQCKAKNYRQAIDRFDKGVDDEKRAKILGKCYRYNYEWFRIDGFNIDYCPYGIKIIEFSDPGAEHPFYQIETNDSIWDEDIDKAMVITNEEFLAKVTEVLSYITSIIGPTEKINISYER